MKLQSYLLAIAVWPVCVLPAAAGSITFIGTVAPWQFNGIIGFYQSPVIDTCNCFGGGSLAGDPFTTSWTFEPSDPNSHFFTYQLRVGGITDHFTSASLTINGITQQFLTPTTLSQSAFVDQSSADAEITTTLFTSLNSFIFSNQSIFPLGPLNNFSYTFNPLTDNLLFPQHQLGGGFTLNGLNGYLDVQSVTLDAITVVPSPIAGTGLPGLIAIALWLLSRRRKAHE